MEQTAAERKPARLRVMTAQAHGLMALGQGLVTPKAPYLRLVV